MKSLLALFVFAAACPFSQAAEPAAAVRTPTSVVLEELDLRASLKAFDPLGMEYLPDDVTRAEIEKNPKKYPVRVAVLEAVKVLAAARETVPSAMFLSKETIEKAEGLKRISDQQVPSAIAILNLEETRAMLDRTVKQRATETSKRWNAHFDYVRLEVAYRIILISEFDLLLGQARMQNLPELDAEKGQTGWWLTPSDKLQSRSDVRRMARDLPDRLLRLSDAYPRTPWGTLALRARETPLGLKWVPSAALTDQ